ncbi:hypothetical protein FACS1894107_13060 [Planctomycetales bacterium]|nr:hypothetical protein FACS1894107_13060 [Planctomycetales bacterium]
MKKFLIILRREFAQLALTPALYAVLAGMTVLESYVFYQEAAATEKALLEPVVLLMGVLSLFWAPILTMRSFAGENAAGTLELLFTAPVRPVAAVLGKFGGAFAFYLLSLLPLGFYGAALARSAEIDWGAFAAMAAGLAGIGAAQIAVGLWVSALTANIIVAAAAACAGNFFGLMLSLPMEKGAAAFSFPAHWSWWMHFKEIFCRGLLDTRSLVFFASFVALFLFLTWLTVARRGAVGGEKMRRRPAYLAAGLFVVAVNVALFGGLARSGFGEIYAALSDGDFFRRGWPLTVAAGLCGAALVCLKWARRRVAWRRENYPAYLAAVAAALIFANVNYLAVQRFPSFATYHRWDLTANQVNTLSPSTRAALDQLTAPLTITVFLSDSVDYEGLPLMRYTRDLLSEFTAYSPKVKTEFFDAVADADAAKQKAQDLGLTATNLTQLIAVNYEDRRQVVPLTSLLREPDAQARLAGIKQPAFQGELVLAIVARRLSDRRAVNVYFAANIGEAQPFGREPLYNSVGLFAEALAREAYRLRPWSFDGAPPPDCDVLVVAGFNKPLSAARNEILTAFLQNGGRLLLLLPAPGDEAALGVGRHYRSGVEKMLDAIGIYPNGDRVFDEKNNFAGQSHQVLTLLDEASPIKTGLPQTVIVMPNTQSLSVADDSPWVLSRVARSLKPSQRFMPTAAQPLPDATSKFTAGPATVIAAAALPASAAAPEARIVVAGSVGWASNLFVNREGNLTFLNAATRWLAGRHYDINVAPREYLTYAINLSPQGWRWLWWLSLVALPEIWLLAAAAVWWRRRE